MSSVLTVDGKEYISATLAGKHFGYTKDYLLLLAKEGKLDGKKIANRWYIYMPSAEYYFKSAEKEKNDRRIQMSLARKVELKKHSRTRSATHSRVALIETLVIVILGLGVGVTGYLGTAPQVGTIAEAGMPFLERFARSVYTFLGPERQLGIVSDVVVVTDEIPDEVPAGTSSLIVAPLETFTETDVALIQDSFSDPVHIAIDPTNPETGVITPHFKDGVGDSYRFLMVPVITN